MIKFKVVSQLAVVNDNVKMREGEKVEVTTGKVGI